MDGNLDKTRIVPERRRVLETKKKKKKKKKKKRGSRRKYTYMINMGWVGSYWWNKTPTGRDCAVLFG